MRVSEVKIMGNPLSPHIKRLQAEPVVENYHQSLMPLNGQVTRLVCASASGNTA